MEELFDDEGVDEEFEIEGKGRQDGPPQLEEKKHTSHEGSRDGPLTPPVLVFCLFH